MSLLALHLQCPGARVASGVLVASTLIDSLHRILEGTMVALSHWDGATSRKNTVLLVGSVGNVKLLESTPKTFSQFELSPRFNGFV